MRLHLTQILTKPLRAGRAASTNLLRTLRLRIALCIAVDRAESCNVDGHCGFDAGACRVSAVAVLATTPTHHSARPVGGRIHRRLDRDDACDCRAGHYPRLLVDRC